MKIIHILPHSIEPFVSSLRDLEDWRHFDHHLVRFIDQLQTQDLNVPQELWVLSSTAKKSFSVQHQLGFLIRVFPRDIPIFLPLETSLSLLRAVYKEIKNNKSLLWHLHGYYLWMYDWIALLLSLFRQKFIAHFRGGGFTIRALPYSVYHYCLALPITLRLSSFIFVQNKREIQRLLNIYHISASKILYTPNCCKTILKDPKIRQRKIRVIYTGRIIAYKGIPQILQIVHELHERGLDFELHLVGEGDLLPSIRENTPKDVFTYGYLPPLKVKEKLVNADIFVLGTYKKEGSSQALIEAQGMGLPAIAFRREGIEDIISNKETGFLVETWDEFADELKLLLENLPLRLEMGKKASQYMEQNFSCEKISSEMIKVYQTLMEMQ